MMSLFEKCFVTGSRSHVRSFHGYFKESLQTGLFAAFHEQSMHSALQDAAFTFIQLFHFYFFNFILFAKYDDKHFYTKPQQSPGRPDGPHVSHLGFEDVFLIAIFQIRSCGSMCGFDRCQFMSSPPFFDLNRCQGSINMI